MADRYYYGKPGTTEIAIADAPTSLTLKEQGYVKLCSPKPPVHGSLGYYVIDETGSWSYPKDDETIRVEREKRILKDWPPHKQLEAHSDAAMGDDTKLNELKQYLSEIKVTLPYPSQMGK